MKLFKEFKPQSKAEWLAKVEKDLKGKPLDGLNWDYQGMPLSPFFHKEDLATEEMPMTAGRADNAWEIGEVITVKGEAYKVANKQATSALTRGANALCFEVNETPTIEEMRVLLTDIQHEWISTHFVSQEKSQKRLITNFIKILKEKKQNPAEVACSFQSRQNPLNDISDFKNTLSELPKCKLLVADTKGLSVDTTEELAAAIQTANGFLNELHDQNLDIKQYHENIQFSLTLSDDYFPSIAKIRALKTLWQQVLTAWDKDLIANPTIEIHLTEAEQSEDENYNKIKATTQAMSAIMGGATRLFIHPSDQFQNAGGNNFSRRIALNINHLMQQESYLDRVVDPAAGSYFIEELTDRIGEKAWEIFRNSAS